jgi:hypothetical protein
LIAWEAMSSWRDGVQGLHVFDRNNEMAGYCGVIHVLEEDGVVQNPKILSFQGRAEAYPHLPLG